MKKLIVLVNLCLLVLTIGYPTGNALAQPFQVQVVVDQLNVRTEPPRFALSTLISFKYRVSPVVQVLGKNSILLVHEVRSIGKNAEWLKITHTTAAGKTIAGWVYAGRAGHWVNVKRIDHHSSYKPVDRQVAHFNPLNYLIAPAQASDTDTAGMDSDIQGIQASPVYVLFVMVFNLALFLAAMFVGKKIVDNPKFVMFTGVCTLLIEGVVTEAGLWGWLEGII